MKALQDKIKAEGTVLSESVLKVDSFLNHQVDPELMLAIGQEFAKRYAEARIDKVLTLESSGIAPAVMTALALKVPLIFARKQKSLTLNEDLIVKTVYSFTKQQQNEVAVSKKFLNPGENVLIIDDFLAYGEAALGMAQIVESSGAVVSGIGIVIEKAFQDGAAKLKEAGYRVDSLARVASLKNKEVAFVE
ncbi:xanthine phosphoribosyltransferase [Paenibacillus sp. NPDC056579]|uniref:xanthine phosphoribosyltransferase n=1 Tax=unclassified Paenibacillus TaxID=185978 RepID=UPI001EF7BC0F|nr:xanthine phosphoribosyltransferase [Paenibacillus sp. H1-7]ULL15301.1 xanthine phosphoribosyltransferase [Paenibacillus sp. H1-7]